MWQPRDAATAKNIGPIRKVLTVMSAWERLEEIARWYEGGGILLISYDIFRVMILNRATKSRGCPFTEEEHATVKEHLLQGPNIIVADEAHKMKNRTTGIAEAASCFRSKSRIALTGSPLANHLEEYYSMINWIAPGYLGGFVQFKAKYVEPIEAGLYADSTRAERRESMKKLQVLKTDLDPKINRADISVLVNDLPPKVEFVITVPLTELQKEAYEIYVTVLRAGRDDVPNARLWAWLSILSLLCNHPGCFMEKLLSKNGDRKSRPLLQDSEYESVAEDTPVAQVLPSETITELQNVFKNVRQMKDTALSHRAKMLEQIVAESIKAGDKILVFSHSIPTLNYIEHILEKNGWRYSRLDGSTPVGSRQAATKAFNRSDSLLQVYLISTKAGGLGLNIPGANRVIIFDFAFNPTWEEQAVGRAYRFGQTKPVFVYRFIAGGTYEDAMYNKTVFKTQLSFRVIDKKNPIRYASKSKKAFLFSPKEVKQQDLADFKGKDPKVLDKILGQENFIREIALTETFQREENDHLTPEEEKAVQEELDDERLKRNDPVAWAKKQSERERQLAATLPMEQPHLFMNNPRFAPSLVTTSMPPPSMLPMRLPPFPPGPYSPHGPFMYTFPSSSAPLYTPPQMGPPGPPPLHPDTSLFAVSSSQPVDAQTATFSSFSTNVLGSMLPSRPPLNPLTWPGPNGHGTPTPPTPTVSPSLVSQSPSANAPAPVGLVLLPQANSTNPPVRRSTSPPPASAPPLKLVTPSVSPNTTSATKPLSSSSATLESPPAPVDEPAQQDAESSESPIISSPEKTTPISFDGVSGHDDQNASNSVGNSPKTPTVEQSSTRCATQ